MHLHNFKHYFSKSIHQRGLGYFNEERISVLKNPEPCHWNATVHGNTGVYTVNIQMDEEDRIEKMQCNCPYGKRDSCKHMVAVLYAIRSTLESQKIILNEQMPLESNIPMNDFLKQYDSLDLLSKRVLKILSIYWFEIKPTKLLDLYKKAFSKPGQPKLYSQKLDKILQELRNKNLVLRKNRNSVRLEETYSNQLCEKYFSNDYDFPIITKQFNFLSSSYGFYTTKFSEESLFRAMRIARYNNNIENFERTFAQLLNTDSHTIESLISFWIGQTFDEKRLDLLDAKIRYSLLFQKIAIGVIMLKTDLSSYVQYIKSRLEQVPEDYKYDLLETIAKYEFLKGNFKQLELLNPFLDPTSSRWTKAMLKLQKGAIQEANQIFKEAEKIWRKETRDNKAILLEMEGSFYLLTQLSLKEQVGLGIISKQIDRMLSYRSLYLPVFNFLKGLLYFLQNNINSAKHVLSHSTDIPLFKLFLFLCQYWVDESLIDTKDLLSYQKFLKNSPYTWLATQVDALVQKLDISDDGNADPNKNVLVDLLPKFKPWEIALQTIQSLTKKKSKFQTDNYRLAWLVDFENGVIQPRHQSLGKNGWGKGRPIIFDRLRYDDIPGLSNQDITFISNCGYVEGSEKYLRPSEYELWKYLLGHPYLFLKKSPKTAVQLIKADLKLLVRETDSGFQVKFNYDISGQGGRVIKESATRYLYVEVDEQVDQIARSLNGKALEIPEQGKDQLQQTLSGLSNIVHIESTLEETNLPSIDPDNRICVHLVPVGDGFHVETYVKPFKTIPPYVKPGQGEAFLVSMLEGERTSTTRDLKAEEKQFNALRKQVPSLQKRLGKDGIWKLETAENCLKLLTELKPLLASEKIILEWPRGEKFRVDAVLGFDQLKMRINSAQNWFEVDGSLTVDEDTILRLQQVLEWSEQQSQFIELSPGKFIALTEEFRKKIKSINGLLAPQKKGGNLGLHPLAAPAMDDFLSQVEAVEVDKDFEASMDRLKKAFRKKFKVPKSFNAVLRPYQEEGYQWLRRSAEWGVGICLADDMGLGKTVQALALLSSRASKGAALVVAPASVCRNWLAEAIRFTPQLEPVLFGEGDRQTTIKKAGKKSLVVVTYDLMAREEKLFTEKEWSTIILDEAQAIKNHSTKRAATAMALKATFKIAMTGTPIENHLGELWSLFQFLNPGLLGSIDHFNQQFAIPIEKDKDEDRRLQLQRLIKPFILRRKKDEVLKDLPEKTEIVLSVDLPPKERAFYEALRRNALDKLLANDNQAGGKHLRILAEIMKLRRAACHPSLADKNAGFASGAKIELFATVVEELLENNHKALVFSQFVDHLKLLEQYLQSKGISYQYLDGSTPTKKRQKAIDAFQNGDGDIFLISLKAGGTGLNLTAADYVIHTDPWWNPAVEDQATDRAHRIGQEKPVTVYRLIAQNTIEEKILSLHAKKRDLADTLLAGTNASAKLSAEDLMNLLKT